MSEWKEPCRICALSGEDFRFSVKKSVLTGHIGKKHKGWTKKQYLERWPDTESHFIATISSPEELQRRKNELAERPLAIRHREGIIEALKQLNSPDYDDLEEEERYFFDQFVEQLIQQTDRDETQMPAIQALAFDMVYAKRLRSLKLKSTKKNPEGRIGLDKDFEDVVKKTEDRITNGMKLLGLTREAQLKQGQSIKSTPSCLISGYIQEITQMSPEKLEALALDEKRVYARSYSKIEEDSFSKVETVMQDEEGSDELTNKPLSRSAAFARAGFNEGAVQPAPTIIVSDESDLPF